MSLFLVSFEKFPLSPPNCSGGQNICHCCFVVALLCKCASICQTSLIEVPLFITSFLSLSLSHKYIDRSEFDKKKKKGERKKFTVDCFALRNFWSFHQKNSQWLFRKLKATPEYAGHDGLLFCIKLSV